MKKSLLILLAGSFLAIYSCSDNKNSSEEVMTTETPGTEVATDQISGEAPVESANPTADPSMQPSMHPTMHPDIVAAPAPSSSGNTNTGPLNPAHGEPGHKCEIAVGAPLNSAPTTAPVTTNPVLPGPGQAPTTQKIELPVTTGAAPAPGTIMTAPAPSGTPTTTAPGMNPPHGEPGHDCAVAVGAPLKK
ncbi:MAG: hypothetical protein M3Q95_06220 [Bacteroidota bacterium]|nr:hypothetical protein [Bacteroidota bacterium]